MVRTKRVRDTQTMSWHFSCPGISWTDDKSVHGFRPSYRPSASNRAMDVLARLLRHEPQRLHSQPPTAAARDRTPPGSPALLESVRRTEVNFQVHPWRSRLAAPHGRSGLK